MSSISPLPASILTSIIWDREGAEFMAKIHQYTSHHEQYTPIDLPADAPGNIIGAVDNGSAYGGVSLRSCLLELELVEN